MIIDGTNIYHQKQIIDPKTGEAQPVQNNLPLVKDVQYDEYGNLIEDEN